MSKFTDELTQLNNEIGQEKTASFSFDPGKNTRIFKKIVELLVQMDQEITQLTNDIENLTVGIQHIHVSLVDIQQDVKKVKRPTVGPSFKDRLLNTKPIENK